MSLSQKFITVFMALNFILGCDVSEHNGSASILPGIKTFLLENPQLGTPKNTENFADWAQGERQIVQFKDGRNMLFYLSSGKVVSVHENTETEGRKKIWGSATARSAIYAKNVSKPQDGTIPQYTVISAINLISGGKHADILIPSLSRNTADTTLSKVAFKILEKEGLSSLNMYSTRAAYKADYSSSFAAENPTASQGRLGSISGQNGEFNK